jgi:hypothetical protein
VIDQPPCTGPEFQFKLGRIKGTLGGVVSGKYRPCPYKDKGQCYVPEAAVAISDGHLSLLRGQLRENWVSRIPEDAVLEPVNFDVESVVRETLSAIPQDYESAPVRRARRRRRPPEGPNPDPGTPPPKGEYVLVVCRPCGDTFKIRLESPGE